MKIISIFIVRENMKKLFTIATKIASWKKCKTENKVAMVNNFFIFSLIINVLIIIFILRYKIYYKYEKNTVK